MARVQLKCKYIMRDRYIRRECVSAVTSLTTMLYLKRKKRRKGKMMKSLAMKQVKVVVRKALCEYDLTVHRRSTV